MPPDVSTVYRIEDDDEFDLAFEYVDRAGNPVPTPEGSALSWSSSNPTVLTVTPAADNNSATVTTTGTLGTCQVSVTDGTITGILDVEVVVAGASTIHLTPTNLRDRS